MRDVAALVTASPYDVVPVDAEVELKVRRNTETLSDYEDIA